MFKNGFKPAAVKGFGKDVKNMMLVQNDKIRNLSAYNLGILFIEETHLTLNTTLNISNGPALIF
jgi:hypothetical protein